MKRSELSGDAGRAGRWDWRYLGTVLCLLGCLISPATHAERRIALIIGNANYTVPGARLSNPIHDATDMADKLQKLGFRKQDILLRKDLRVEQIEPTLTEFRNLITGAAQSDPDVVALVFYSGHGMQLNDKNYLPAVNARIKNEFSVQRQSIVLSDVLNIMRAGKTRVNLVFLDSCRDNPFSVGTKSATRGLIKEEPPSGTLIAYATQYGKTADDNPGSRNGVFTGQLLQHIGTPNITVEQMFKLVAAGVVRATRNREKQQEPWPEGFLYGDFYFVQTSSSAPVVQSPAWQRKTAMQATSHSRADRIIKDCDVCPELVVLPRGSFMMGSPETEAGRLANEGPVHQVMIDYDLAVGRFEVTQGQWRQIMGNNPSQFQDCGEECPVEKVSWNEVQAYIRKLNERSGKNFRLLSEAEWEYAVRAGAATPFSVGSVIEVHQANFDGGETYNGSSISRSRETTRQVGGFEPNAFGLYDMHGNVWELVQDLYHHDYGGAPTNGSAWESGEQKDRVLRGGSWSSAPKNLRSAGRSRAAPDSRSGLTGFRIARPL